MDIDAQSLKRDRILIAMKENFGEDNVVNIGTIGREGTKSTIQTACRGLHLDSSLGMFLSSLVPVERGKAWSLDKMFNGDPEKDIAPITEFVNEVAKYPNLKETMERFEGLVNKRSVHAAGMIFFEDEDIDRRVIMRAPSGQLITQYDMKELEGSWGLTKMDFLTVEALDIIRITMDFLIDEGFMEWQGSLRKTYNKYLHPDVLDYETEEMWELIERGEVLNLFQFTTDLGISVAKKVAPRDLKALASANSLMRLATDEEEQPIDKFVKYNTNKDLWISDVTKYGLNEEEIEVLLPHLEPVGFQANTQEDMMEMLMNPKISGFSMVEANKARGIVAKVKIKEIAGLKEDFFRKGLALGTRRVLLEYIWHFQIEPQMG